VSNRADSIKIACDFVSLNNLMETLKLFDEFREHRLSTGVGDDVLQLFNMLWYAWVSLSQMQEAHAIWAIPQSDTVKDFDTAMDSEQAVLTNFAPAPASSPAVVVDGPMPSVAGKRADPTAWDAAFPSNGDSLSACSAVSHTQNMSDAQLRKIMRRKANNRRKKDVKAYTPGPNEVGRNFKCGFCPRMFERAGLIRHL
jgi:hypothetical protein